MATNQLCTCIRGCHSLMLDEDVSFNQMHFESLHPEQRSVFLNQRRKDKHHLIWCPSAHDYLSICEKALENMFNVCDLNTDRILQWRVEFGKSARNFCKKQNCKSKSHQWIHN